MTKRILLLSTALFTLLIQACNTLPEKANNNTAEPQQAEAAKEGSAKELSPASKPATPLSGDTLYQILVAEIAGKRDRKDVALGNYLQQAHKTRDPQIVARATRIAQYLNAHQATLDASLLWTEIEPENIEPRQITVNQLLYFNRFDEAIEHMGAILEKSSAIDFSPLIQNTKHLGTEEIALLSSSFDDLLAKHPNIPSAWVARGLLAEQSEDYDGALTAYNESIKLTPDNPKIKLLKAKVISSHKGNKEAAKYLKKATKTHPNHKGLGIAYVKSLVSSNELGLAQKQLKRLAKQNPQDGDLILTLGLIAWENKLPDQAKRHLNYLFEINQRENAAHFYLGKIAESEDELESALKHYTSVEPGAHYPIAQNHAAQLLYNQGRKPEAYTLLENARGHFPEGAINFFVAHSDLLSLEERNQEAFDLLSSALESYPNDPNILYSRAMVAEKLDKLDTLENDLLTIINEDPNNAAALNALGYTLADRSKRYTEAHTYIKRAFNLSPQDPAIIDSMGWVHYRKGNHSKALHYLEKAYKIYPDHEIAAHLGEVLWVSGQQEKASSIWESALGKQPDSKILKTIMKQFLDPDERASKQPAQTHLLD